MLLILPNTIYVRAKKCRNMVNTRAKKCSNMVSIRAKKCSVVKRIRIKSDLLPPLLKNSASTNCAD